MKMSRQRTYMDTLPYFSTSLYLPKIYKGRGPHEMIIIDHP